MSVIPSNNNGNNGQSIHATLGVQTSQGSEPIEAIESATPPKPIKQEQEGVPFAPVTSTTITEDVDKQIALAVDKLNSYMVGMQRELEFAYDQDINRTVVTVRDANTQEVVRQLPSEMALKLAKVLQDNPGKDVMDTKGQLLDTKT